MWTRDTFTSRLHIRISPFSDVGKIPAEEIYAQAKKAFVEKKT
jgi:hypothetical protein